jgi:membrane protein implicated in regulation of membrane protease activity
MFLVIISLSLAALAAYLFPEWSWATVLIVSFACVAAFRLFLFFTERSSKASKKSGQS